MMSMRSSFLRHMRRMLGDERGVSVIEFAFVAPFLGIMTVAMSDIGRGYIERYRLQQAANRTVEMAQQGVRANSSSAATRSTDYTFLRAEAATAAGVPEANVTVTQWLECTPTSGASAGVRTTRAFNATCASPTDIMARYVTLEIVKPFDPMFTTAGYPDVAANGTVPFRARATLRVQ